MMYRFTILCLSLILTISAANGEPSFQSPSPGNLVVRTERFEAGFSGAALVRLVNRLNDQAYELSDGEPTVIQPPAATMPERFPVLKNLDNRELVSQGAGQWICEDGQARYVEQSGDGGFTILLRVDPVTGDLLLSQTGFQSRLGARSLAWGIPALDQRGADLIVPAYGGVHIGQDQPLIQQDFSYPLYWEFQLAIVQHERGGFSVWSDDTTGRFKTLEYRRSGDRFALAFVTENPAPFRDKTEVRSVVWRLNVHQGDWSEAAGRYRDWMQAAFALTPWAEDVPWAEQTGAMVKIHGQPQNMDLLDSLATRLDPARTMLYIPEWRRDGYDVNYPDYTPSDWVKGALDHAHKLGFKVMLHASLPGISPSNPAYERFRFWQLRDGVNFGPIGWRMEEIIPVSHFFINPGLADYRTQCIARLKDLTSQLPVDALHLDVSAPMWNDGQGLVEGMTYGGGVRELHRELKQALPEIVLGGENINELTLVNERFYQVWKRRCDAQAHPVRAFLCQPFAAPVGYLGMPNPDQGPGDYAQYMRDYEHWGVLPTLSLSFNEPGLLDEPGTQALLAQIRLWQTHGFKPDFATSPTPGQVFRWQGEDAAEAVIEHTGGDSVRLKVAGETLFERIRGCNQYETPLGIQGWPARDGERVLGLDPSIQYTAAGEPDQPPVRIVDLTPGITLNTWRSDATATLIIPAPAEGPMVADLARLFPYASAVFRDFGSPASVGEDFSRFQPQYNDQLMGSQVIFESYFHGLQYAKLSENHAATLEYQTALPPGKPLTLRFEAALSSITPEGQNARLRVDIDDREAFTAIKKDTLWQEYAVSFTPGETGKTAILFAMMPETAGQTPRMLWRGMRVTEAGGAESMTLRIQSDRPLGRIGEGGRLDWSDDTRLAQDNFEPIVLLGREPSPIDAGSVLTGLPFTFGAEGEGIFAPGMSAWGSGVVERTQTAQGTSATYFNAHPPSSGRTVFRQAVIVGDAMDNPALHFTAVVREGALTQGLGFEVRLNGRMAWNWSTEKPGQKEGSIALDNYRGRPLLIEWITDAQGDSSFDWAQWVEPHIAEAAE